MQFQKQQIKDLFEFQPKSKVKAGEGLQNGEYKFFTSSDIQSKYLNRYHYDGESLILASGGQAGIHYCEQKFSASNDCFVVRSVSENVYTKYVYYYLAGNISILQTGFRGAGLEHLSKEYLKGLAIPLPPLPVQKQITAILEKADATREKRRQVNQLTEQFLQSSFLEMFGDPVTNPKGWPINTIGSVVKFQGGFAFKSSDYITTGVKLVKITNVHKDVLVWDDLEYLPEEYLKKYEAFALSPGDIVMSMTRPIIKSLNSVKVVKIQRSDIPCLLNQRVGRFLPDQTRIHHDYLLHFCYSEYFKNKVDSYCSTSLQPNISADQIEEIQLPLPNICEQNKFAALVEKVESLRAKQRESEKELENLFQSLMQRAFKGELVG